MPSTILVYGFSGFVVLFVLHVFLWRTLRPRKEMLLLLFIFLIVPILVITGLTVSGRLTWGEAVAAGLLLLSISVAYIQTYPGLKDDIPSFRILMLLDRAGTAGMLESELLDQIGDNALFAFKVDEMEHDRLVIRRGEHLQLSAAGHALATMFVSYRKLLGLDIGKG